MALRDLALQGLETTLNRLIRLDPEAPGRLAALHGQVVAIELRGTPFTLTFIPDDRGALQVYGRYAGEPDCTLAGSPLDLLRASDEKAGPQQLFAGHVSLRGDTDLGHRFSAILAGLEIDWEEQLSRLTGDVAAHEIGRGVRQGIAGAEQLGSTFEQNLSEYLTEEAGLLPHRYEAEDFLDETDRLRDAVDRLEARIRLLEETGNNA
jgi:ubiquinone biosynthesis protein UbiJ